MLDKKNILSNSSHNKIFIVPENYFDSFPDRLEKRVFKLSYLYSIEAKKAPYKVPASFFELQASKITNKTIYQSELSKDEVALIYTVPERYFDELPTKIQNQLNRKTVFSFENWASKYWLTLSASAIIIILFVFVPKDQGLKLESLSMIEITQFLMDESIDENEIIEIAGRVPEFDKATLNVDLLNDKKTNESIKNEIENELIEEL